MSVVALAPAHVLVDQKAPMEVKMQEAPQLGAKALQADRLLLADPVVATPAKREVHLSPLHNNPHHKRPAFPRQERDLQVIDHCSLDVGLSVPCDIGKVALRQAAVNARMDPFEDPVDMLSEDGARLDPIESLKDG